MSLVVGRLLLAKSFLGKKYICWTELENLYDPHLCAYETVHAGSVCLCHSPSPCARC